MPDEISYALAKIPKEIRLFSLARKLDIKQDSMRERAKYITLAAVGFFLFTAVVYACPGISFANTSLNFANEMPEHNMGKGDGCTDHKINTCQSVRDQLVSIKAVAPQAAASLYPVSPSPEAALEPVAAMHIFHDGSPPSRAAFHPVFKLQLAFSYLVLRL